MFKISSKIQSVDQLYVVIDWYKEINNVITEIKQDALAVQLIKDIYVIQVHLVVFVNYFLFVVTLLDSLGSNNVITEIKQDALTVQLIQITLVMKICITILFVI